MSSRQKSKVVNLEIDAWKTKYAELLRGCPRPGTVLKTKDGSPAQIGVTLKEGESPFLRGYVYVPNHVNCDLGYFLQPVGVLWPFGQAAILLPQSREELIRRHGLEELILQIKSLVVVRKSNSGRSLMCEVMEYD